MSRLYAVETDRLILDTQENLDRRWLRAHQYLSRIGKYRFRAMPARTLFGWTVYLLRRIFQLG